MDSNGTVGSPNMVMMYDAQPFSTKNEKRGGYHTGQDLNGIGGENTDLGSQVCAAARGLVVYSGVPSSNWGNVVVIAHRIPGQNSIIQTLYAHLDSRLVKTGQFVNRGQLIGHIGTADGQYLAHLHFDTIQSRCIEAGMPGYHPTGTMNRMNPEDLIASYPAPQHPDSYDAVRRLLHWEAANAAPVRLPGAPIP